jgi:hypothetical protein
MGTVSRVHTFASGAILTAAQLNNEFDNLLTSSAINGGLDATNLGVTAGQATASKALVVDASRNLADATGSNRINNLALSGTFESTGAVTASAGITSGGNIVSDTDSTDDLGTTGVRWANLYVDDVTVTNNVTIGGTLTLTGGITLNGNTTIGDSSADTLTVNSTITSNLIFTDATYDIGASGATRPRDLHLSRNALMGGTLGVTGLITATGGVSGALTGDVTGNISGNVTGGTISGTTGTFSGNVTLSKDAPQLIMTDTGSGGGTSDIIIDAIGLNHGFYFRADGATNHVILESNGDFKVDADTLYIDASTDRVGVNNASPSTPLHVKDASTAYVMAETTGTSTSAGFRLKGDASADYTIFTTQGVGNFGIYDNANTAQRLTIDTSGNMALGVTPSAWLSTIKALQVGDGASVYNAGGAGGDVYYNNNWYVNSSSQNIYLNNGYALSYGQAGGEHRWFTAPSGTAGNTVSFTQAMTLTAAGNLTLQTNQAADTALAIYNTNSNASAKASLKVGYDSANHLHIYRAGNAAGIVYNATQSGSSHQFQIAGSAKATLDGTGLGIGTTSPSCRTHIRESTLSGFTPDSNTNLAVEENSTSMIEIAGTDSGILFSDASAWAGRIFYTHSTDQMAFATAQSNKMTLDSSGNCGIGSSSPVALSNQTSLTVNGTSVGRVDVKAGGGGGGVMFGTSSALTVQANSGVAVNLDSASGQPITFQVGSSEKARIDSSGNLLVGYTSSNGSYKLQVNSQIFATNATIATSDGRYKEDVQTLSNATDLVTRLNPVQFRWKAHETHNFDVGKTDVGFIAQEVQAVLSDTDYSDSVVVTNKTDDEEFLGLGETKLIPLLTAALQEAITKIETLETKVAALEAA